VPASNTPEDEPQRRPEEDAAAAAALAALAAGKIDPFLPSRWARLAGLVRGERSFHAAFSRLLDDWLAGVRRRVIRPSGVVDLPAAEGARPAYASAVDDLMSVQVGTIFRDAFEEVAEPDDWEPYGVHQVQTYLAKAENFMVHTPDTVFDLIRQEVARGVNDGDSVEEMAFRVQDVLSSNAVPTWRNRGLVVARTEAVSAYNAGTFAGYQSLAAQLGGEWEKGWLCTHDARTRPTHFAADLGTPGTGQRVPLDQPFQVGESEGMFPGAPELSAEERIQCRCSMVLLRPGEKIDLSNRHMRGAK
jgi:hypothetical protein